MFEKTITRTIKEEATVTLVPVQLCITVPVGECRVEFAPEDNLEAIVPEMSRALPSEVAAKILSLPDVLALIQSDVAPTLGQATLKTSSAVASLAESK